MKIRLVVYLCENNGRYYSTRTFPENTQFAPTGVKEIFSVERDVSISELEQLEEDARAEARKRGLPHIINLD